MKALVVVVLCEFRMVWTHSGDTMRLFRFSGPRTPIPQPAGRTDTAVNDSRVPFGGIDPERIVRA